MEYLRPNVTANGIAGKAGEWIVVSREKIRSKAIVIYHKKDYSLFSDNEKYKVQIFSRNGESGELWKEFDNIKDVEKFLEEAKEMILYKGKLMSRKEFYRVKSSGGPKHSLELQIKIINYVLSGNSTVKTAKKFRISYQTICKWLHRFGYIYVLDEIKGHFNGRWIFKNDNL